MGYTDCTMDSSEQTADSIVDVLIVEDDAAVREALARALEKSGLRVRAVSGIEAAKRALERTVRAVLLDIELRDGDGLALLTELRKQHPKLPVVMATAHRDSERTISAMRLGAYDYLTKPFDVTRMIATLKRAIEVPAVAPAPQREASVPLVGASAKMLEVWKAIGRAASSDVSLLITGESGTGKELVARAVHEHSARKRSAFVAVNVAALSPTLFESELFGHEKGAFTGAHDRRIGRFEAAGAGTLFLDEIGDLEPSLQVKLLRVLQEGQFERVGGVSPMRAQARVIAATSRPVSAGEGSALRADLFYRLAVLQIAIPPLRERKSDIPLLVHAFLRRVSPPQRALSESAMQRLIEHPWPGNVRELLHVVERARVMSTSEVLDDVDLGLPAVEAPVPRDDDLDLQRNLRALERSLIERALARSQGNRSEAARLLGIARPQLYTKMRELGITQP